MPGDTLDEYPFALCLTHDVDRPYKSVQAPYYAVTERDSRHLNALLPGRNPWWQFDRIRSIEREFGVRSAFYFLQEPHLLARSLAEWVNPTYWVEHLGRYDITRSEIGAIIRELHRNGWEVGVHGSLGTRRNATRLTFEKERLESVLGDSVNGVRQHHLDLDPPVTWRHHRTAGFSYDTSLGSASDVGFEYGYEPHRPFDDEFVVFPVTIMDKALASSTETTEDAWDLCASLLSEARDNNAVMTVLWHVRNFCATDYPGHGELYRRLIHRALEMGAWVGSPGTLYEHLETDAPLTPEQGL